MNNEEAKFILQGYRPNGADAGDATFIAAIEQTKRDPALGQWFDRLQSFDAAVSAKLAQVSPPADLRASILAGGRVTAASAARHNWWNQPVWMAAAAGLAVIFATSLALWPKQAVAFDDFVLQDSKLGMMHGHGDHGEAANTLQQLLGSTGVKLGPGLPVDFAALHDTGCRIVSCRGREVVELCFSRDGVWFHCYIAVAADFPEISAGVTPTLVDKGGVCLAAWKDAGNVVVVVSKTGRKNLEALL